MKRFFLYSLCSLSLTTMYGQKIVTTDVENFWKAYDVISVTKDSAQQYEALQKLYLDKGTEGLKNIMTVRRYKAKDYIDAINKYPQFWKSIRKNTLKVKSFTAEIDKNIAKLKEAYPALRPVPVYFTIGAFRTNGTIFNRTVLIGSEMALSSKEVNTSELPERLQFFYKTFNPIDDIGLLCTHEYVHTQQNELADQLLYYCLYEGVAEFVSTKVTGKPSYTTAIAFGKTNESKVRKLFEKEMFNPDNLNNWLWGINRNELTERDLGYYIGYAICERYYDKAKDKRQAIKDMIELDYNNPEQIETFVNQTRYFSGTLQQMSADYEKSRPVVTKITPVQSGSGKVTPGTVKIALTFSEEMDKNSKGFDFGPLGETNVLKVANVIGYSDDGRTFTFEANLEPGRQYQSVATARFRTINGIQLKPFLIDITTAEK